MKTPQTFHELLKSKIEIEKFNPYHDRLGRFASSGGAASFTYAPGKSKAHDMAIARAKAQTASSGSVRNYGKTDCSDALDEIKNGKENSLSKYIDANGKLSAEREAVHKQIIDDFFAGKTPVEGTAEMRMMGGGPASGKSSVEKAGLIGKMDEKSSVTVDPDYFKAQLPGYKEMAKSSDKAAAFYHEESSALAKRAYSVALEHNYNVTYDGTGDGSVNSVKKKIDAARAKGYKVTGEYVTIDTKEAIRRNQKRYDDAVARGETARKPPEAYVKNCHAKVTDISVETAHLFDKINVWDNNGAVGSTKLIATGGNGQGLKAVDKDAFNGYLSKGNKSHTLLSDGTVRTE